MPKHMLNVCIVCQLILHLIFFFTFSPFIANFSRPALKSLELPYCCPIHAKLAVAGAAGGPVHVFGREAKPGIALLCQARRLHQHPPQSTTH
jgi:hypothetical protein